MEPSGPQTICDCVGPNARTSTGECRTIAEAEILSELRRRRMEGQRPTNEEVDELVRSHGLVPYSELVKANREQRDQEGDGYGMKPRLQRLGVPPRVIIHLDAPEDTPAILAAKRFMQLGSCQFLGYFGPTGVGKTVAAAWVFREVARHTSPDRMTGSAEPLVWVQAPMLTRLSAFSSDDERTLQAMRNASLLVVDELGDEGTTLGSGAVRDVLMAREAAKRRTVLTSNLRPDAFQERYGKALWDRIWNYGLVPTNLSSEKSRRKRAAL